MLMFSINLFAQEIPISESSAFIYDKNNYGNDFLNIVSPFSMDKNGAVWCHPYNKEFLKIGNVSSTIPLKDKDYNFPFLNTVFQLKNCDYYCTDKSILVVKNGKVNKNILLNKEKEQALFFKELNNNIYFITIKYIDNSFVSVNTFDGNKITVLKKFFVKNLIASELVKKDNKIYFYLSSKEKIQFYNVNKNKIVLFKQKNNNKIFSSLVDFKDLNNYSVINLENKLFSIKNDSITKTNVNYSGYINDKGIFSNTVRNQKYLYHLENDAFIPFTNSSLGDTYVTKLYSTETNSYYCGTNGSLVRLFPHIKKYPQLYFNSNSNSVFALQQDSKGQIWAGSYQGIMSQITNDNKVLQSKNNDIKFLNGGIKYKEKMLFFGESNAGLLMYSDINNYKVLADDIIGFYAYISKSKKIFLGTSQQGLWFTDCENLDKSTKIKWNKTTDKEGLTVGNILTICEDKFGNIWSGGNGISVYNPNTNKAITWKSNKKTNSEFFSTRASILDTYNTIWFGSKNGELIYYNGKNATDYDEKNFISIKHPLFENGKTITFIHQWHDYLILGASNKILLFDLKKWYNEKKVSVRYLNSMEINLTNETEQNTILTDKRDKSIWFATSDMVYQWDIKKWLSLPTFKVFPTIVVKKDSTQVEFSRNKTINFRPTENSFDIQINYQTKDNMPRFINGVLVKKGEKLKFGQPNLQTKFQYMNLSSGDYIFYVRVCQQDGSFDIFEYLICIDSFLWQKWWFWVLLSIPFFGIIIYFFQKRNQMEIQKKKLSQLNLSSLSNQFRPHFMLNTLNSIGSQLRDKPHAEKVISRLGESINILYGFTQKNKFTLSFENEMKLVENSIEIQRLLFIPELAVTISNKELIPDYYKIPVGIIQIPIENALLHGLRHKTNGDCHLEIEFDTNENNYYISITDNGVGREKASKINNFKTNGNGLKTVFEMIEIINQHQKNAISFEIIDLIEPFGTKVKIVLNKNIDYDKIKI
jgi:hypothetical protein